MGALSSCDEEDRVTGSLTQTQNELGDALKGPAHHGGGTGSDNHCPKEQEVYPAWLPNPGNTKHQPAQAQDKKENRKRDQSRIAFLFHPDPLLFLRTPRNRLRGRQRKDHKATQSPEPQHLLPMRGQGRPRNPEIPYSQANAGNEGGNYPREQSSEAERPS